MMRTLSIAWKDLQVFFRDPGSLVWAFLLPLVFIVLFTFLSTAAQRQTDTGPNVELAIVDADGGTRSSELINGLTQTGEIEPRVVEKSTLDTLREADALTYLITIPAGFSDAVDASRPSVLRASTELSLSRNESTVTSVSDWES